MAGELSLLLNLLKVDVSNGLVSVEDAGNLLESRSLGLNDEEVNKDQFAEIPKRVEEHEMPVLGEVVPGELVGLASKVS